MPIQEISFQWEGREMHVLHVPGDSPMIFVHGLNGCKEQFLPLMKQLAVKDPICGMIAIDLVDIDEPTVNVYTTWAKQLQVISENLKCAQYSLVLHSMAAGIFPAVTEFCKPGMVCFLEGNLVCADTDWTQQILAMSENKLTRLVQSMHRGGVPMLKMQMHKKYAVPELNLFSQGYCRATTESLRCHAAAAVTAVQHQTVSRFMADVSGNYYYLQGEKSGHYVGIEQLAENGVALHEIPDAGHYPHLDAPEYVAQILHSYRINSKLQEIPSC